MTATKAAPVSHKDAALAGLAEMVSDIGHLPSSLQQAKLSAVVVHVRLQVEMIEEVKRPRRKKAFSMTPSEEKALSLTLSQGAP